MNQLTPGEEVMMGALARQVADGDWAAGGTGAGKPEPRGYPGRGAPTHRLCLSCTCRLAGNSPLTHEARRLLYGPVKEKLAFVYPHFATRLQVV